MGLGRHCEGKRKYTSTAFERKSPRKVKEKERELKTKVRTVWRPGWIRSQAERRGAEAGKCCLSSSPWPWQAASSVISYFLFVFSSWWPAACTCTCLHMRFGPCISSSKKWWRSLYPRTTGVGGPPMHSLNSQGGRACFAAMASAQFSAGWQWCPGLRSCRIVFQQLLGVCKRQLARVTTATHP